MKASPQVVIGLPHLGDLPGYFVDSLIHTITSPPGIASVIRVERNTVDVSRNIIARTFLGNPNATHLFFMDADMSFPSGVVQRLVDADKDIVGGTYFSRTETPVPHVYKYSHDQDGMTWYRTMGKEFATWAKNHPEAMTGSNARLFPVWEDSLQRCDALATGCMLIKREVLEKVRDPWFEFWPGSFGGEDFRFCEAATSAGFEVWADFGVQCAHEMRNYFVGAEDFVELFRIGTADEVDTDKPILVEVGPSGRYHMRNKREEDEIA